MDNNISIHHMSFRCSRILNCAAAQNKVADKELRQASQ